MLEVINKPDFKLYKTPLVLAFNSSIQEAEVGESLWIWGQPGLLSDFRDNQTYKDRDSKWKWEEHYKASNRTQDIERKAGWPGYKPINITMFWFCFLTKSEKYTFEQIGSSTNIAGKTGYVHAE